LTQRELETVAFEPPDECADSGEKILKNGTSLYPRFHAERGSPIDHRIEYERHRTLADDGRLRWFLRS
jgi:hypothetical protein